MKPDIPFLLINFIIQLTGTWQCSVDFSSLYGFSLTSEWHQTAWDKAQEIHYLTQQGFTQCCITASVYTCSMFVPQLKELPVVY